MHAAHDDSAGMDPVVSAEHRLFSVRGLDPRLQQELTEQFESVLAFADFCNYVTDGRVGDRAGQLVDLAQALLSDTTEDLQRGASRG
jgi:hypothetical protein